MEPHLPDGRPLLTIAIPTYNRQAYLTLALRRIMAEIDSVGPDLVEVIVSDNCSSDETPEVVQEAQDAGLRIRYVRNEENLGWARNFAQCVDLARGKYVLLSGDDDVLCEGALQFLQPYLVQDEFGVICVRPYGFDNDYRTENPGGAGRVKVYHDAPEFLIDINQYFTLTSALIVNRDMLRSVDSRAFVHTSLATFHLFLRAALAAKKNLYIEKYLIASKRQNSFSYEYYKVFVEEFWSIIDHHIQYGLPLRAIRRLERRRLFIYYPFYMFDLRVSGRGDRISTYFALKRRFGRRFLFTMWVAPILLLPRPLAVVWGGFTVAVGRTARGDFRRGVTFLRDRILRRLGTRAGTDDSPSG